MRSETLINHPTFKVQRREGTEGPRHDPYGYSELHVVTKYGTTVLHEGLGVWLRHDGIKVSPETILGGALAKLLPWTKTDQWYRTMFSRLVGYTPTQIDRIARRASERCRKCGGREFENVSGYPGETFHQCVKCKHINGASMNLQRD